MIVVSASVWNGCHSSLRHKSGYYFDETGGLGDLGTWGLGDLGDVNSIFTSATLS